MTINFINQRKSPFPVELWPSIRAGIQSLVGGPQLTVLVILRLLYGIGMGGEWGLGAALAMEKIPTSRRGFFSGILQASQTKTLTAPEEAKMKVGNAGGLEVLWSGSGSAADRISEQTKTISGADL